MLTVGIACSCFTFSSAVLSFILLLIPHATMPMAIARATIALNLRLAGGLLRSGVCISLELTLFSIGCNVLVVSMYDTEYDRYEKQGGYGGGKQTADHGATKRGVLFAAFSQAQRHGRHADDHRKRRHQNRPEPRKSGLQCGPDGVAAV